jgi:uncharacterized protein YgiB involved in biofilm formation
MKRSQAVSLVLLAGLGTTALVLAGLDPSQDEEDALIYRSERECRDAHDRSDDDCRQGWDAALTAYRASAPRYEDRATCERHHGRDGCRPGRDIDPTMSETAFVPLMSAFMIGRLASQAMPAQPLYAHRPEDQQQAAASSGGSGGYCAGSGARVTSSTFTGRTSVPLAASRGSTTVARTVSRGGFGFTGRSVAMASSHAGGSHGFGSSGHGGS